MRAVIFLVGRYQEFVKGVQDAGEAMIPGTGYTGGTDSLSITENRGA